MVWERICRNLHSWQWYPNPCLMKCCFWFIFCGCVIPQFGHDNGPKALDGWYIKSFWWRVRYHHHLALLKLFLDNVWCVTWCVVLLQHLVPGMAKHFTSLSFESVNYTSFITDWPFSKTCRSATPSQENAPHLITEERCLSVFNLYLRFQGSDPLWHLTLRTFVLLTRYTNSLAHRISSPLTSK